MQELTQNDLLRGSSCLERTTSHPGGGGRSPPSLLIHSPMVSVPITPQISTSTVLCLPTLERGNVGLGKV